MRGKRHDCYEAQCKYNPQGYKILGFTKPKGRSKTWIPVLDKRKETRLKKHGNKKKF